MFAIQSTQTGELQMFRFVNDIEVSLLACHNDDLSGYPDYMHDDITTFTPIFASEDDALKLCNPYKNDVVPVDVAKIESED